MLFKKPMVFFLFCAMAGTSMAQTTGSSSSVNSACQTVMQARAQAAANARARRQQLFDNSIGAQIDRMKQSCLDQLLNMDVQTINVSDISGMLENFVKGAINKACSMVQSEASQMFSSTGIGTTLPYGLDGIINSKGVPIGNVLNNPGSLTPTISPQTTFPTNSPGTSSVSPSIGQKILNSLGF